MIPNLPKPASQAKPRIVTSCTTPKSHRALLTPSFSIQIPPSMPAMTAGQRPAFLAIRPMSVLLKPMSR